MKAWDALIENDHFFRKMQVVFIADGEQTDYFTYVVNSCKSNFEVYIDSLKHFTDKNKLNAYPNETFLLNPVNEIILIGTPLYNPQIKRLYRYLYHSKTIKSIVKDKIIIQTSYLHKILADENTINNPASSNCLFYKRICPGTNRIPNGRF